MHFFSFYIQTDLKKNTGSAKEEKVKNTFSFIRNRYFFLNNFGKKNQSVPTTQHIFNKYSDGVLLWLIIIQKAEVIWLFFCYILCVSVVSQCLCIQCTIIFSKTRSGKKNQPPYPIYSTQINPCILKDSIQCRKGPHDRHHQV